VFSIDPHGQSNSVTAVLLPDGHDADALRQICLNKFNVSLGGGLGPLKGRLFRIGHLGDVNETMILGALAAIEISLELAGVPHGRGGVQAAMEYLATGA
jgi:alanine-glyoxylate transaminase/serine-glyoxylate transaminase/serine-pyruvate transaminase